MMSAQDAPRGPPPLPAALQQRATQIFGDLRRQRREIVTPEGVAVTVEIADYGERLAAFSIDFAIWSLLTLLIYLPVFLVIGTIGGSLIAISIALFIGFVVRNLYFIYFELAWQGSTPGKRAIGLRVIDHRGGPLLPSAVIARNLTREVEMFIPLGVLLEGGRTVGGGIDWSQISTAVWLLYFAALPVINRDRMRGGDLIAGTMVIALPRRALSSDLVERTTRFSFTPQQLQTYGAFELQVLEELLRRPPNPETSRVLSEVCEKICRKSAGSIRCPTARSSRFCATSIRRNAPIWNANSSSAKRRRTNTPSPPHRREAANAAVFVLTDPHFRSVEDRRDAIGIDAFLDDPEIVIGNHHHDGVERACERAPDQLEQTAHDRAGGVADAAQHAAADSRRQHDDKPQTEDLPTVALRQGGTAPQALHRAKPFDNARRHRNEQHGHDDEGREEQQNGGQHSEDSDQQRHADHRKEPGQTDLKRSDQIDRPPAHVLERAEQHDRLTEGAEYKRQDDAGERHCGDASGSFAGGLSFKQQKIRQIRDRRHDAKRQHVARQNCKRSI